MMLAELAPLGYLIVGAIVMLAVITIFALLGL